jgi:signal transduction histidine kinase
MAVNTGDVRSASLLAALLLRDVERIAERSAARMQEMLPSYAKVPRHELTAVVLTNTRNLLEAIRDPDADPGRAQEDYRASGEARARQGITSDEMLHGWRIGLDNVREEAHAVADEHEIGADVLLEFVEATLRWGDIGMRASATVHHEAQIRELGRLVEEQAALRRVATLVARGGSPEEVFVKVAEEVALLLGADSAAIQRFEADGYATVVGNWGKLGDAFQIGSRLKLDGDSVIALVYRTRRPVRVDDYEHASGSAVARAREVGLRSGAGSPIVVNGHLWGAMGIATSRAEPLALGVESRIAEFTELVGTAISNVQARSDLAESRARVVAASDKTRRQIERDLHDGAQQRLVSIVLKLKQAREAVRTEPEAAPALVDQALDHAQQATVELRELVHGILPPVLTQSGLRAAVKSLARRMPVPVEIDVRVGRFPAAVEATAYFVVAEALTNVAKHSGASLARVAAHLEDSVLQLEVRDDGVGGARPDGSGFIGLADRLAVFDGRLRIESPEDGGTLIAATIPVG